MLPAPCFAHTRTAARRASGLYRFYLPLIADFWGRILVRQKRLHGTQTDAHQRPVRVCFWSNRRYFCALLSCQLRCDECLDDFDSFVALEPEPLPRGGTVSP